MSSHAPPGRIGNPDLDLSNDPRTDPNLKRLADAMGMGPHAPGHFDELTNLEYTHTAIEQVDAMITGLYNAVDTSNPEDANEGEVVESVEEIDGPDNNKIKLYVLKPKSVTGKLPGVVYIHGGGMTVAPTRNPVHDRWCKSLALQNQVVIMIDFRNAWTKEKPIPFPAGLNDCAAGVQWIASNRDKLGINKFIIEGESGGANLSLAVAIKANREGWVHEIAGVYGYVPYISGAYGWSRERKLATFPSMIENEDYLLNQSMQAAMAYYYSPGAGQLEDPLAWPYHASEQDLKGLPPHAISVDELDGLRDEGIEYWRKLTRAGVQATCEVNLGVTHAAALMFRNVLPGVARKQVDLVAAFARRLQ